LTLNELCTAAHSAAVAKGWYERPRELPELLMLVVSELSEALEADRNGRHAPRVPEQNSKYDISRFVNNFDDFVKDTVEDEIADAVIRIADLCGHLGIDLDAHVAAKMKYNLTRPYKHGKAY
jgi:NTP pyrophosphatase (non-canonical NTP hydrolase)